MPKEDWELVPKKFLEELSTEVHSLKTKVSKPAAVGSTGFSKNIADLNAAIKRMENIFQSALKETENDEVSDIVKKLAHLEKQNEQIAEALLTIADMIDGRAKPMPQQQSLPKMPAMQGPVRMRITPPPKIPVHVNQPPLPPLPPPPVRKPSFDRNTDTSDLQLPPPPPQIERKRGLFGKIFKR